MVAQIVHPPSSRWMHHGLCMPYVKRTRNAWKRPLLNLAIIKTVIIMKPFKSIALQYYHVRWVQILLSSPPRRLQSWRQILDRDTFHFFVGSVLGVIFRVITGTRPAVDVARRSYAAESTDWFWHEPGRSFDSPKWNGTSGAPILR